MIRSDVGSSQQLFVDFEQVAKDVFDRALYDARMNMHPLLRNKDVYSLERRVEFVHAFRHALAWRIAQNVAACEPDIDTIFQFDANWMKSRISWDGSIHLLAKVYRLSNFLETFRKGLDQELLQRLQRLGWSCFQDRRSVLELQQVTRYELQHRICYGAMFSAVYSVPIQVWPN